MHPPATPTCEALTRINTQHNDNTHPRKPGLVRVRAQPHDAAVFVEHAAAKVKRAVG